MEQRAQTLIVEDEELARQLLASYIGKTPSIELAGVCGDVPEAASLLRSRAVDLIFLDIRMPEISGLEFLRTLRAPASPFTVAPPAVVLTTACADHALESYELDVVDYLLKPFSFDRFLRAVNKALQWHTANRGETGGAGLHGSIPVRDKHRDVDIPLEAVLFLESYGNYTKIHTAQRLFIAGDSLKHFEATLPAQHFCRIHKGTIVARRFVERIDGNTLVLAGHRLNIGITYKTHVLAQFPAP